MEIGGRLHIILNGEPLEKWIVLSTWDRKCQRMGVVKGMWYRLHDGYRSWGALKSVLNNRGLGINAKKCLYERVFVPTALYRAEAWGMRSAERRKVNVLKMKCLRSLVVVSRMNRVRNEEVHRRAGIRELTSRVDQRVLRWFRHVERMDEYCLPRRMLMADVSGGGYNVDRG